MLQLLSVMLCQQPTLHHLAVIFSKGRDIFGYPTPTCHKLPHNRQDSTWQFSSVLFLPCGPFTAYVLIIGFHTIVNNIQVLINFFHLCEIIWRSSKCTKLTTSNDNISVPYFPLLTPRCRVLLEQLTGLQLVKKFPTFHGTQRFITALTSVRHLSLSLASPIQSIYPHPTSWRSILILSTHLRLAIEYPKDSMNYWCPNIHTAPMT